MQDKFYKKFIKPRSLEPDRQNREVVLNWLLTGFMGLAIVAMLNVLASLIIRHELYIMTRLVFIAGLFGFLLILYTLSRRYRQQGLVSLLLVSILFGQAAFVLYRWGIINPNGILLLSLSVIMAGILLGARYSLYSVGIIALLLTGLEYSKANHYFYPDLDWMRLTR